MNAKIVMRIDYKDNAVDIIDKVNDALAIYELEFERSTSDEEHIKYELLEIDPKTDENSPG